MKNLHVALALVTLITACGSKQTSDVSENQTETSAEKVVAIESTGITPADSAYVNSLLNQLQGIEKFGVGKNFGMLASLLAYKGDSATYQKVYNILQKKDEYVQLFNINMLDNKNGYIVYAPIGAEVTYTEVYWNMKDGSKLLATEAWGCGPVCSSDIYFTKFKDGTYTSLETATVIPDVEKLPKMLIPEYDPEEANADPIEFKYVLPQKGKNIQFCVEEKCIELIWSEGTFHLKE